MRLTRVSLANHSRLRDVDIHVREHLVLIGANDVGKTSLLRFLNLLLGSSVQQLFQAISTSDLRDPGEPLTCRATLINFSTDEQASFPDEITVAADGTLSLTIELRVEVDPSDPEQVSIRRWFPDGGDRAPSRDQLAALGWQYLPANRTSAGDSLEGPRSPLRAMLGSTDLGSDRTALVDILTDFNAKLDANDALKLLRAKIAAHLSEAMPRSLQAEGLTIRSAADPTVDVLEDVTLFLKNEGGEKALAEQSDGVRQLMTMTFFDLAQSSANMVAIDEPELHLHASSQRTVADLFAQSSSQRLLVTHSPYVVQRFEPKHVAVVTPNQEVRQISEAHFSAVEKELANWWSPHLLESLTSRHTLVVEGAADKAFVEACARTLDLNLDRCGVSVLDLGGADKFKHVSNLLGPKGFDLALIGLVDDAEKGSWLSALKVNPKKINSETLFVATADLEDEYAIAMSGPTSGRALISEGVCREQGLLQASGRTSVEELTPGDVAAFARSNNRKVTSAVAVGKHVTAAHIAAMPAISGLLAYIKSL